MNNETETEWGNFIKKSEILQENCCICLQSLKSNPDENKLIQSGIIFKSS